MAICRVKTYPDPCLRQAVMAVEEFGPGLSALIGDLTDTLLALQGLGLTAPHLGILRRVTVIVPEPGAAPRAFVNPRITWQSPTLRKGMEGSLSMPGVYEEVERAEAVRILYQDAEGVAREEMAEGMLAICLQHEIDQLDGIFWLQRLSRLKRERAIKKFQKR